MPRPVHEAHGGDRLHRVPGRARDDQNRRAGGDPQQCRSAATCSVSPFTKTRMTVVSDDRDFFGEVFQAKSAEDTRRLYDDWAEDYERAHRDKGGYLAPQRCAEALARFVTRRDAPVLDLGCGTGLAGAALRQLGFTTIDGTDISAGMLKQAAARRGVYRSLYQGDLNNPLPVPAGSIEHALAAGVLSPAHAPARAIADVMTLLPAEGCFSFSLNDHSLADASYQGAIDRLLAEGQATQLFREHGINVPGTDLHASVIVLRKSRVPAQAG